MAKLTISAQRKLAIHEAGHAAASIYLRRGFKYGSIVPNDDVAGHVRMTELPKFQPDTDDSGRTRRTVEREITIEFAGLGAEYVTTGRKRWKLAAHDTDNAAMLASYVCGTDEEISAYLNWLFIRTCQLMRTTAMRGAVSSIADALVENEMVNAKECRRIYYDSIQSLVRKGHRQ